MSDRNMASWEKFVGLTIIVLAMVLGGNAAKSDSSLLELDGSERVIKLNQWLEPFALTKEAEENNESDATENDTSSDLDDENGDPERDSILDYDVEGEFTENAERELMEKLEAALEGNGDATSEATEDSETPKLAPSSDQSDATRKSSKKNGPADLYRLKISNESSTGFDRLVVFRQPVLYGSLFKKQTEHPLKFDLFYNTRLPYVEGAEEASLLPTEQAYRIRIFGKPAPGKTTTIDGEEAAWVMDLALDLNRPITNELIYLWDPAAYQRHARAMLIYQGLVIGFMIIMAALLIGTWLVTDARFYLVASLFVIVGLIFVTVGFGYLPSEFEIFDGWIKMIPALSFLENHDVSVLEVAMGLLGVVAIALIRSVLTFDPADFRTRRGLIIAQWAAVAVVFVGIINMPFHGVITRVLLTGVVGYSFFVILRQRKKGMMGARLGIPGWSFIVLAFIAAAAASFIDLGIPYYYFQPALYAAFVFGSTLIGFALFSQAASGPFTGLAFKSASAAATGEALSVQSSSVTQNLPTAIRDHDVERFELGLSATKQGLWDWNLRGNRLYLSPYVSEMLGSKDKPFALTEEAWYERIHPRDQKAYRSALSSWVQLGNASFAIKFRIRDEEGRYRHLELKAKFIPDDAGKAVRCIGTLMDLKAEGPTPVEELNVDDVQPQVFTQPKVDICELTGLLKRDSYIEESGRTLEKFKADPDKPTDKIPAILVVEIDRFPTLNEGLGREKGDKLLQSFAQRIVSIADADDVVGRIGGDEFSIFTTISSEISPEDLAKQAQDILSQPLDVGGTEIHPSATIGTAIWTGEGHDVDDMLRQAEKALSEAKEAGKQSSIEHYRPGMGEKASEALALEGDLRRALDRFEMEVFFQPIMDLKAGRIAGFEALLRWNHPQRGMIGPDEFVPLAEEVGLIVRLSRFTLSMAAIQLSQWQQFFELEKPLFVSVNISTKQLLGEGLVSDVSDLMKSVELQPGSLKLEITESALIEDEDEAHRILKELKELNIDLVVDDYGTGHSGLDRLKSYPFSGLKIDKKFVTEIDHDKESEVIVSNAIKMASDLSLYVIAEGIESEAVGRKLFQMKCDFAQGFVFGAPMSAMDAQAFIANYWAK